MRSKLIYFAILTCLAPVAFAKELSVKEFRNYAQRRLVKVEAEKLDSFVALVDKDQDGKISETEFKTRLLAYQEIFQRVEVKPQKLGHNLPENWHTDWKKAQEESVRTGKPIVAMFSASWCGPCKTMIATVFPTDEVQTALKDFVPVYIDSEKDRELAGKYDIRAYPTFKCITPEQEEASGHVGGKPVEGFVELLGKFKTAAKEKIAAAKEAEKDAS